MSSPSLSTAPGIWPNAVTAFHPGTEWSGKTVSMRLVPVKSSRGSTRHGGIAGGATAPAVLRGLAVELADERLGSDPRRELDPAQQIVRRERLLQEEPVLSHVVRDRARGLPVGDEDGPARELCVHRGDRQVQRPAVPMREEDVQDEQLVAVVTDLLDGRLGVLRRV